MADRPKLTKFYVASTAVVIVVFAVIVAFTLSGEKSTVVAVTGIHHMGNGYSISSFHLNGGFQGNISREGGGSVVCCVSIPVKWRPGININIRWAVADWREENEDETSQGNYRSIRLAEVCRANVAVEKYLTPGRLYIHFFPHGRVRVVSSDVGPENFSHPVREGVFSGEPIAGACETKKED